MRLATIEMMSSGSGAVNEDRAGAAGPLAWVIDGATDIVERPLAGDETDASWFAAAMNSELHALAAGDAIDLPALPERLTATLAQAFETACRRAPSGREEHPSASAVIVKAREGGIAYVSVGDCALLAGTAEQFHYIGEEPHKAGDRWVAEALALARRHNPDWTGAEARDRLWPKLGTARRQMNLPGGYGVFSITAPPPEFIRTGHIPLSPGAIVLLATDGLTRLVDIFRKYDTKSLFAAAGSRGLTELLRELREAEHADADCANFPRAKVSDDATGLLLRTT